MHGDAAVAAFRRRVDVIHDPAQEVAKGQPRTESARVTIMRRGQPPLEKFVPWVRGFPSHPMSRADVETKARDLIAPVLGRTVADEIVRRTAGLDDEPRLGPLVALVTR
ncbi:hypothetical protein NHF48_000085 [Sphingomonas sp. H160509]|uniref:hypothetical protein n=1 Tax=Sphingomonas sp. H160509 TaxID=2955313 RepID=UPI0020974132|nr:hypothetical protein [Sphingomonas sp. H160509]MDD1449672.1 hypothetical protein [Sphingomonas sp. H160509]